MTASIWTERSGFTVTLRSRSTTDGGSAMRTWLLAVMLAAAAVSCGLAGSSPAMVQGISFPAGPQGTVWIWQPDKSGEHGIQADSRLDRPVRFWRAGLTLAEVFAGVQQQTGVKLSFWPPDDLNTRTRVNLYLNPKDPPSLRALMVQLIWVTECAFAFADEPGERVYYLLSAATTADARAKMAVAEVAKGPAEHLADIKETERRWQDESLARVKVYAAALRLSRDDLVEQYKERDDYLLYNLLDPKRRAAIALTCGLPEKDQEAIIRAGHSAGLTRDLGDWDANSRALIETIFGGERGWGTSNRVRIVLLSDGIMSFVNALTIKPEDEGDPSRWESLAHGGIGWGWSDEGELSPREQVALRRLLGEKISDEDERTYIEQRKAVLVAEQQARNIDRENRRQGGNRVLSQRMAGRLASAVLPMHFPNAYMLWELQKATAEATGLNIISDSFCDLPRPVRRVGADHAQKDYPLNALEALSASCTARSSRDEMLANWEDIEVVSALGWEWGDAGDILRFRSLYRDIWRASLLPADVVERTNSWVEPYLTPEAMAKGRLTIPVDPYEVIRVAGQLTTEQARYGKFLWYGDPADEKEQRRLSFRYFAISEISWKPLYQLLSTLTPKQWELARGDGLRMGYDLSPDQRAMASESLSKLAWTGPLAGKLEDFTMRLRSGEPAFARKIQSSDEYSWHLEFVSRDKVVGEATVVEQLHDVLTFRYR